MWCGNSNRVGIGAGSLEFIASGVALTIRSMPASCARTAVSSHDTASIRATGPSTRGSAKKDRNRSTIAFVFAQSAIDQDQALTIFQRALPRYGMTRASAGAKDHHSQITQID